MTGLEQALQGLHWPQLADRGRIDLYFRSWPRSRRSRPARYLPRASSRQPDHSLPKKQARASPR